MSPSRITTLTATCPRCGAPPRLRTFPDWVSFLLDTGADPELEVQQYQCHRKSKMRGGLCNEVYTIRVKHFREVPRTESGR
jgi:hypothetical protein